MNLKHLLLWKMFFRATDVSINHKWDRGKITRKPSPKRPGERTYTCTRCGLKRTEEIPYEGCEYTCVYGEGSKWIKGSGKTLTFRFERSPEDEAYERYETILVDGEELYISDYNVEKGSLIVELKTSFLETLSLGNHEIEAKFNDGYAEASFTVVEGASAKSVTTEKPVKTGGGGRLLYWLILLAVSALTVIGAVSIRRSRT